jgi:hypothetical protein
VLSGNLFPDNSALQDLNGDHIAGSRHRRQNRVARTRERGKLDVLFVHVILIEPVCAEKLDSDTLVMHAPGHRA